MNTSVESNVWRRILHSLEGRLNHQALETWFRPIQFERLDSSQHVIHLRAPNQIVRDWVVSNYAAALDESLNEQRLNGYSVGWVIGKVPEWITEPNASATSQAALSDVTTEVKTEAAVAVSAPVNISSPAISEPSLSSKYTYESFVVGS